jgi:hydroxyacylglutathione hydrolase
MKTHGPLSLETFVEPMFQENAYLLWSNDGPDAWIVDPGFPPQPAQIAAAIRQRELTARAIVLTHCHVDHVAGVASLREEFPGVSVYAPQGEEHMLGDARANLSAQIGMQIVAPAADKLIAPGDPLTLGPLTWQALDVCGHSPGGRAYHCAAAGVVFTGDALFAGSIGRTDFPGSSMERLLDNIRQNLLTLPGETVVYSGHGPPTTVAAERDATPFLMGGYGE